MENPGDLRGAFSDTEDYLDHGYVSSNRCASRTSSISSWSENIRPSFTQKLKFRSVMEGQPVVLNCKLIACPTPKISWFHNNRHIFNNPSRLIKTESDMHIHCSNLEIKNVQEKDSGSYKVFAINSEGSAESTASLLVALKEEQNANYLSFLRRSELAHERIDSLVQKRREAKLKINLRCVGSPFEKKHSSKAFQSNAKGLMRTISFERVYPAMIQDKLFSNHVADEHCVDKSVKINDTDGLFDPEIRGKLQLLRDAKKIFRERNTSSTLELSSETHNELIINDKNYDGFCLGKERDMPPVVHESQDYITAANVSVIDFDKASHQLQSNPEELLGLSHSTVMLQMPDGEAEKLHRTKIDATLKECFQGDSPPGNSDRPDTAKPEEAEIVIGSLLYLDNNFKEDHLDLKQSCAENSGRLCGNEEFRETLKTEEVLKDFSAVKGTMPFKTQESSKKQEHEKKSMLIKKAYSLEMKESISESIRELKAEIKRETAKSKKRVQNLWQPRQPKFVQDLKPLEVSEGETCAFECHFVGHPQPTVTWYKNDKPIPRNQDYDIYTTENKSILTLCYALTKHEGVYTCVIFNQSGTDTTSNSLKVIQDETKNEFDKSSKFQIIKDTAFFAEGEDLANIADKEIEHYSTPSNTIKSSLQVPKIFLAKPHPSDSGILSAPVGITITAPTPVPDQDEEYKDSFSLVQFHSESSSEDYPSHSTKHKFKFSFDLVSEPPGIVKEMENICCTEGDSVVFECFISGDPEPEITWLHDNTSLNMENTHYKMEKHKGQYQLYIDYAMVCDAGKYTCFAKNKAGEAESVGTLLVEPTVKSFIPVLKEPMLSLAAEVYTYQYPHDLSKIKQQGINVHSEEKPAAVPRTSSGMQDIQQVAYFTEEGSIGRHYMHVSKTVQKEKEGNQQREHLDKVGTLRDRFLSGHTSFIPSAEDKYSTSQYLPYQGKAEKKTDVYRQLQFLDKSEKNEIFSKMVPKKEVVLPDKEPEHENVCTVEERGLKHLDLLKAEQGRLNNLRKTQISEMKNYEGDSPKIICPVLNKSYEEQYYNKHLEKEKVDENFYISKNFNVITPESCRNTNNLENESESSQYFYDVLKQGKDETSVSNTEHCSQKEFSKTDTYKSSKTTYGIKQEKQSLKGATSEVNMTSYIIPEAKQNQREEELIICQSQPFENELKRSAFAIYQRGSKIKQNENAFLEQAQHPVKDYPETNTFSGNTTDAKIMPEEVFFYGQIQPSKEENYVMKTFKCRTGLEMDHDEQSFQLQSHKQPYDSQCVEMNKPTDVIKQHSNVHLVKPEVLLERDVCKMKGFGNNVMSRAVQVRGINQIRQKEHLQIPLSERHDFSEETPSSEFPRDNEVLKKENTLSFNMTYHDENPTREQPHHQERQTTDFCRFRDSDNNLALFDRYKNEPFQEQYDLEANKKATDEAVPITHSFIWELKKASESDNEMSVSQVFPSLVEPGREESYLHKNHIYSNMVVSERRPSVSEMQKSVSVTETLPNSSLFNQFDVVQDKKHIYKNMSIEKVEPDDHNFISELKKAHSIIQNEDLIDHSLHSLTELQLKPLFGNESKKLEPEKLSSKTTDDSKTVFPVKQLTAEMATSEPTSCERMENEGGQFSITEYLRTCNRNTEQAHEIQTTDFKWTVSENENDLKVPLAKDDEAIESLPQSASRDYLKNEYATEYKLDTFACHETVDGRSIEPSASLTEYLLSVGQDYVSDFVQTKEGANTSELPTGPFSEVEEVSFGAVYDFYTQQQESARPLSPESEMSIEISSSSTDEVAEFESFFTPPSSAENFVRPVSSESYYTPTVPSDGYQTLSENQTTVADSERPVSAILGNIYVPTKLYGMTVDESIEILPSTPRDGISNTERLNANIFETFSSGVMSEVNGSPPAFIKTLTRKQVPETETVTFITQIKGSPMPDIKWYKNKCLLEENAFIKIEQHGSMCVLEIQNVQKSDEGEYVCKATNIFGEAKSITELEITPQDRSLIVPPPVTHQHVIEFDLEHDAISRSPSPQEILLEVELDENEVKEFEKQIKIVTVPEFTPDNKSMIISLDVLPMCVDDDGLNFPTSESKDVKIDFEVTEIPPRFLSRISDLETPENTDAVFECSVIGRPIPQIAWFKDNLVITDDSKKYIVTSASGNYCLKICSVSCADAGSYECRATNSVGESVCKGLLLISKLQTVAQKAITDISLGCATDELQKIDLLIDKADQQGTQTEIELEFEFEHGTGDSQKALKLIAVTEQEHEEKGEKCVNINFDVFAEPSKEEEIEFKAEDSDCCCFEFAVTEVPPKFIIPLSNCTASLGSTVCFHCALSGTPKPTVKWYKDGRMLHERGYIEESQPGYHELKLTKVNKNDEGEYKCIATNRFGSAETFASLNII